MKVTRYTKLMASGNCMVIVRDGGGQIILSIVYYIQPLKINLRTWSGLEEKGKTTNAARDYYILFDLENRID